MTALNQADIRTRLTARLEELRARIAHLDAELHAPLSADWEEQATDLESQDAVEGQERAALAEAQQIFAALGRLDAGHYGDCVECGNAIAAPRLAAVPTATRCITCAR